MSKRGANQSVSTKYATTLLCDALRFIESGRIVIAVDLIKNAVSMLPDVDDDAQEMACVDAKNNRRGIAA